MSELEPLRLVFERPGDGPALPQELRRLYGGDLLLPERCLYANFVSSLDGVVAIPSVPGSSAMIGGPSDADRFVMGLLRAAADVVLIGSGTLVSSPRGRWRPETVFPPAADGYAALRRELGHTASPRVAVVTASGSIPGDHPALEDGALVLTTRAGAARLASTLPGRAELEVLPGESEVDIRTAVELLYARGHNRILSEAGPHVFGSLVADGLVDELFLTVSPLLAGRGGEETLGLVEDAPFLPGRVERAVLRSVRIHGSHVFLQQMLAERLRESSAGDTGRMPTEHQPPSPFPPPAPPPQPEPPIPGPDPLPPPDPTPPDPDSRAR
ncbi:MAG TPA: dihydrofolate reductase family protein [Gaiella sp.]|nr:dihydrofolate reductase family protein [Gaiella sp.]